MTNEGFYAMLTKRRSYHDFKEKSGNVTEKELDELSDFIEKLRPLDDKIKTKIKTVPREKTTCKVGEYAVLIYSEKAVGYLENVGYIGEQIDLYLESLSIGVCWYGLAKPIDDEEELPFAIMLAIGKVDGESLRKSEEDFKRKALSEIWHGEKYSFVGEICRLAPSAVNSQVWLVEEGENSLAVIRKRVKIGIIPISKIEYFNCIDMGIFLFFLDVVLSQNNVKAKRELKLEKLSSSKVLTAEYKLSQE